MTYFVVCGHQAKIVVGNDNSYGESMISAPQCRAARGLVGWSQQELAEASRVGLSTVRNFEAGRSMPMTNNLDAMIRALDAAGVEFILENGGGAGVRLKKGPSA